MQNLPLAQPILAKAMLAGCPNPAPRQEQSMRVSKSYWATGPLVCVLAGDGQEESRGKGWTAVRRRGEERRSKKKL
jgi:hypothetical protein